MSRSPFGLRSVKASVPPSGVHDEGYCGFAPLSVGIDPGRSFSAGSRSHAADGSGRDAVQERLRRPAAVGRARVETPGAAARRRETRRERHRPSTPETPPIRCW